MNLSFRYSSANDKTIICALLKQCFGDRSDYGALDALDNRYLLAFDGDNLVAMTGINAVSVFNGYEIDWTCVHPDYRHQGIITGLIRTVIGNHTGDIYCSCLHLGNHDRINLYHAMSALGFVCVLPAYKKFDSRYTKACNDCVYRSGPSCICFEDLYILRL